MSDMQIVTGPGPHANRRGTQIKNGRALQVVTYPREHAKAVLVDFAKQAQQGVSAFLILAGLDRAAQMKSETTGENIKAQDLIPEEEYAELLRKRGGKAK